MIGRTEHGFRAFAARARAYGPAAVTGLAPRAILLFQIVVVLATCYFVALLTLRQPLGYDAARFLGASESIGTTLSYEELNFPPTVFDPNITMGGPMLYLAGAGFALTHNSDVALVVGTVSGTLILLVGLALLRWWLTLLPAALLPLWPMYHYVSTSFVGELWSGGMLLIGLAIMERMPTRLDARKLLADRRIWFACLCFGVAMASKLLISFAVFAVAFATIYERDKAHDLKGYVRDGMRALGLAVLVCVMSAAVFLASVCVAVTLTTRSLLGLADLPSALAGYLAMNFGDAGMARASHLSVVTQADNFSSHLVLLIAAMAAIVLLAKRPSYMIFVIAAAGLWLVYDMNERRMVPMFVIILALGLREAMRLAAQSAQARGWSATGAQAALATALLVFVVVANPAIGATGIPPADPLRRYAVEIQDGPSGYIYDYHYRPRLISVLRAHRYVLTDHVWMLPEITDFWGIEFYDRMALENAALWNSDTVLLFDRDNPFWPTTTVAGNCGRVLYSDGPLVVCRPRGDVPLSYQPSPPPFAANAVVYEVTLDTQRWVLTPKMRAQDGPGGSVYYSYVGTGSPVGVEGATLSVPVEPGRTYVFSARVDPSHIATAGPGNVGEFDLLINPLNNKFTYAGVFSPEGPPSRYATSPWLCPPGITRVELVMQLVWTAVKAGQHLSFSDPILSYAVPGPAGPFRSRIGSRGKR